VKNQKAIVTIVTGERYQRTWKTYCEGNWQRYGEKHGYDIICIEKPLDTSPRANSRSSSWQKCLTLGQDFAARYERIVWCDSDVLINTRAAPSIIDQVPIEKVGAVELFCYSKYAGSLGPEAVRRMFEFWNTPLVNRTAQEYYADYGLAGGFDTVVQAGVLVLSPKHHRDLLEKVYFEYDGSGKEGAEWHYEMRPLSYELLKANAVHWIDPRFNWLWIDSILMHYPFILTDARPRGIPGRAANMLARNVGGLTCDEMIPACLGVAFLNSYFLHFGGGRIGDMMHLDTSIRSWKDSKI
jgi:hypothetical protein